MTVSTIPVLVPLVALCLVGCTGSTSSPQTTGEREFASADLARLTEVAPEPSYWQWPPRTLQPPPRTRTADDSYAPEHPSQEALAAAHADAGFVQARTQEWLRDGSTGSAFKGSASATLFASSEGAADAVRAGERFARSWFTDVERAEIHGVEVDDLGNGAWGVRGGTRGAREFAEIGWRRGNVVLEVYLLCSWSCPSPVDEAAREWAAAIDATALAAR